MWLKNLTGRHQIFNPMRSLQFCMRFLCGVKNQLRRTNQWFQETNSSFRLRDNGDVLSKTNLATHCGNDRNEILWTSPNRYSGYCDDQIALRFLFKMQAVDTQCDLEFVKIFNLLIIRRICWLVSIQTAINNLFFLIQSSAEGLCQCIEQLMLLTVETRSTTARNRPTYLNSNWDRFWKISSVSQFRSFISLSTLLS